MYIENWESFYQQAEALYTANPLLTRYSIKYRHCDGKLSVKVTDNTTCLQYKTDQQADLKKVDKLNALFFALMATGQAPQEEAGRTDPVRSAGASRRKG
ncbi:SRP9 [Auxenochlorella protothecoides x Auxenochlorella symbiontica]